MNFRAEGIKKATENDRLKLRKTRLTGFEFKRNISQPSYIKNGKVLPKNCADVTKIYGRTKRKRNFYLK